ncbi:MAG TPA: SUMF1/EgtB/PvdO family nonheme iron enzyme [Candidatus Acidoferrales bacterium]|nr:SUMF1/EgtB/PvdO family nonheme iron enzyme [Candidatus Acidoferrales bacterium]
MLSTRESPPVVHTLHSALDEARTQTDSLFEMVKPDSLYDRPIAERHRVVFYIGHLEAFDRNLLGDALRLPPSAEPEFDKLFAFGIDPVGGGLPSDQPADWPRLDQVRRYAGGVRRALDQALAAAPGDARLPQLLHVAIEHRQMHAETLAYMFHQLSLDCKIASASPASSSPAPAPPSRSHTIPIPAGLATLGRARRDDADFGWDNEYEAHQIAVPAFTIDEHMVTNRQFEEFIAAGGYDHRSLWTEDDWSWKNEQGICHPAFWKPAEGGWMVRTMFHEIPLPPDWPVYVSHAEASAYARWLGKALPTEAQWHRAAYGTPDGTERAYPWGAESPARDYGNFDFQSWDPAPVGAFPRNRSAFGVAGMLGNGWEWTSTPFEPFPGFQPFPFYPGYSANFFDGKHYVIKGGSARTARSMLRRSFRNWFQANYPYVYAGFRCAGS